MIRLTSCSALLVLLATSGCGSAPSTPSTDLGPEAGASDAAMTADANPALVDRAAPDALADVVAVDATDAVVATDAVAATDVPTDALRWTRCYTNFFCTDVSVPLDWSRPDGARVTVGVLRARARVPAARVGVLMVNYGGPGSSTSEGVALRYPNVLGSVVGAQIADRYDIVAVDWRGHGRSRPAIECGFVRNQDPTGGTPPDPDDDTSWSAFVAESQRVQRACAASLGAEFLARVGTDDMVRDMERVRELLGERQVTYVGYSYGAWLGAMYMTLAPASLRATVIDAPPAPRRDARTLTLIQAGGFQRAYDRFFAWCARDTRCTLAGRDEGAEGVARAFSLLVARLDAAPLTIGLRRVRGDAALSALTSASYAPESRWVSTASALAQAAEGNARSLVTLVDGGANDDQFISSYLAVRALDNGASPEETADTFRAFLRSEVAPIGRFMPRFAADNVAFVAWPARRAQPLPVIAAPRARPALVVSSRGDATTPYEGALQMRDALGNNSRLLTYEGGLHCASTGIACAGTVVREFLDDPDAPLSTTTCPEVSF